MTVIETRKYRTLKYIVIGLLMAVDLFILYLIFQGLKNQASGQRTSIDFILIAYGLVTIPLFLIISYPLTKVSDSFLELKYLGIFKIKRAVHELKFCFNDKGDGIKIKNKSEQKLVTIYQENTVNYNDIVSILENKIDRKRSSKSKVRWTYVLWLAFGLVLYITYGLTK